MYFRNLFLKNNNKSTLFLLPIFLLSCLWITPLMAAPASFPTDWIYWMSDPDEDGTNNDYRDVQAIYYQIDDEYLYLRLQNRCECGWGENAHGRWKWFIDTVGNDAHVQGGTIYNAEFMLMLEDHMDNTLDPADHDHSSAVHDLLGELLLLDDLDNMGIDTRWGGGTQPHPYFINEPVGEPTPSPYWQREVGTGTGGFGGEQGVFGEAIGYHMEGQFVDMYFSLEHIGSPESLCMYWSTDQENNNLDQAPIQDRPSTDICFDIEVTGSITINKHIDPVTDTDASFAFGGDLGTFNLDIVAGAPDSMTFEDLSAGSYAVFEDLGNLPEGWLLGSIICDDPSQDSSVDLANGLANIELAAGEEVVCTYTNVEAPIEGGTIIIVKHAVPHSEALFEFTSTISGFEQFTLNDTGDDHTLTIPDLEPGIYEVSEVGIPEDWHLDNLVCVDPSEDTDVDGPTATIDLSSAEVVTCTFSNGQSASITIEKQTLPDGSQVVFNFSGDLDTFELSDGQTMVFDLLDPDDESDYVVTENPIAGWKLQQIDCVDPTGGSSIDLGTSSAILNIQHGDEITCSFINSQLGSITVLKLTDPAGHPAVFGFTGDLAGSISDTQSITVTDLPSGTYSTTEAAQPDWLLTSISCDDFASDTPSAGDINTRTATFYLDPGEHVTCTFVNFTSVPIPVNQPLAMLLLILMLMATGWYFRPPVSNRP